MNQTVPSVEYTQTGKYDYTVEMSPSYLYEDIVPVETEDIYPVPVAFIHDFTLYYQVSTNDDIPLNVGINVIIENPGLWQKSVVIKPERSVDNGEQLTIPINLSYFQEIGEMIEKEIGSKSSKFAITVEANVSDNTGHLFTQTFPISLISYYLDLDQDLVYESGEVTGQFSYRVQLIENSLFDTLTITSPETVNSQPATDTPAVLGSGDTIVSKFINTLFLDYTYQLSANQQISSSQSTVEVEAILENPGNWTKTIILVPETEQDRTFTIRIPLDLDAINTVFSLIQNETSVYDSGHQVTIRTTVRTKAETPSGLISEVFVQSIRTDLMDKIFSWEDDVNKSTDGILTTIETVTVDNKLLGQPVIKFRILFSVLSGLFLILTAGILMYYRTHRVLIPEYLKEIEQIHKKHGEYIIEVVSAESEVNEPIIVVESFADLVKVSQGLLKPINHRIQEATGHEYWVTDGITRYEYRIKTPYVS